MENVREFNNSKSQKLKDLTIVKKNVKFCKNIFIEQYRTLKIGFA